MPYTRGTGTHSRDKLTEMSSRFSWGARGLSWLRSCHLRRGLGGPRPTRVATPGGWALNACFTQMASEKDWLPSVLGVFSHHHEVTHLVVKWTTKVPSDPGGKHGINTEPGNPGMASSPRHRHPGPAPYQLDTLKRYCERSPQRAKDLSVRCVGLNSCL